MNLARCLVVAGVVVAERNLYRCGTRGGKGGVSAAETPESRC